MSRSEARGRACDPFQARGVVSWSASWWSTFHAVSMHSSFVRAFGSHDVLRRALPALFLLDARQDAFTPCFVPLVVFPVCVHIPAFGPGLAFCRALPGHEL